MVEVSDDLDDLLDHSEEDEELRKSAVIRYY
jgi:hypothetical protein